MAGDFLKYLDQFEKSGVGTKPVSAPTPKAVPKQKPEPTAVIVESVGDDDYLMENGWKFKNQTWIDPVTRNLLIWEAACAVQQERDRVGTAPITEHVVSAPTRAAKPPVAPAKPQPKFNIADHASSILDGVEWDDESSMAESFAQQLPEFAPLPGEPSVIANDIPMTDEERMFAEAQNEYATQSGGDTSLIRSLHSGMDMANLATDMLFD